ncbi:hypothetical protein PTKIN_Ptkin09bG0245300 [Pterospermum kingtungense]
MYLLHQALFSQPPSLSLSCCPMQRHFFYEFPHPTFHFMQNTLPNLKHSLSLTLQHFFPLAGKIKLPPPPQRPYIFFTEGDYIPFLVAESEADFNHHIGNQADMLRNYKLWSPNYHRQACVLLEQVLSSSICLSLSRLSKSQFFQMRAFP